MAGLREKEVEKAAGELQRRTHEGTQRVQEERTNLEEIKKKKIKVIDNKIH